MTYEAIGNIRFDGMQYRKDIGHRAVRPVGEGAKVTTVVFDKTGTITEGRPVVSDWRNLSGLPDKELLGLLAAAENGSEHYLAKALREFAQLLAAAVDGEKVANFRVEPGHGIAADVDGRGIVIGNAEWLSACGVPTTALDEHCARAGMEGKTPVLAALDGPARCPPARWTWTWGW